MMKLCRSSQDTQFKGKKGKLCILYSTEISIHCCEEKQKKNIDGSRNRLLDVVCWLYLMYTYAGIWRGYIARSVGFPSPHSKKTLPSSSVPFVIFETPISSTKTNSIFTHNILNIFITKTCEMHNLLISHLHCYICILVAFLCCFGELRPFNNCQKYPYQILNIRTVLNKLDVDLWFCHFVAWTNVQRKSDKTVDSRVCYLLDFIICFRWQYWTNRLSSSVWACDKATKETLRVLTVAGIQVNFRGFQKKIEFLPNFRVKMLEFSQPWEAHQQPFVATWQDGQSRAPWRG